jgi:hypothetical protein
MLSLALLLSPFLLVRGPVQDAPAAGGGGPVTYDLSCKVRLHEPVLVESKLSLRGTVQVQKGELKLDKLPIDASEEIQHVDEYESFDKPAVGDFLVTRTYVKWHTENLKKIEDPEWTGVSVRLGRENKNSILRIEGRKVRESEFNELERRIDYAGAWLPLPRQCAIGAAVELDHAAIARLLHIDGEDVGGKAELELAGVDASGTASIRGVLELSYRQADGPLRVTHAGPCTLRVDVNEQKLKSFEWTGNATLAGQDAEMEMSGTLPFQAELKVTRGEGAAKVRAQKSSCRDREYEFKPAGVMFKLPSHWMDMESTEADVMVCSSFLYGSDEPSDLELKWIEVERSQHEIVVAGVAEKLRKDFKVLEERRASNALGKGCLMRAQKADGTEFWLGLYACGERGMLRIQLYVPKPRSKDLPTLWSKFENSLKRKK